MKAIDNIIGRKNVKRIKFDKCGTGFFVAEFLKPIAVLEILNIP